MRHSCVSLELSSFRSKLRCAVDGYLNCFLTRSNVGLYSQVLLFPRGYFTLPYDVCLIVQCK